MSRLALIFLGLFCVALAAYAFWPQGSKEVQRIQPEIRPDELRIVTDRFEQRIQNDLVYFILSSHEEITRTLHTSRLKRAQKRWRDLPLSQSDARNIQQDQLLSYNLSQEQFIAWTNEEGQREQWHWHVDEEAGFLYNAQDGMLYRCSPRSLSLFIQEIERLDNLALLPITKYKALSWKDREDNTQYNIEQDVLSSTWVDRENPQRPISDYILGDVQHALSRLQLLNISTKNIFDDAQIIEEWLRLSSVSLDDKNSDDEYVLDLALLPSGDSNIEQRYFVRLRRLSYWQEMSLTQYQFLSENLKKLAEARPFTIPRYLDGHDMTIVRLFKAGILSAEMLRIVENADLRYGESQWDCLFGVNRERGNDALIEEIFHAVHDIQLIDYQVTDQAWNPQENYAHVIEILDSQAKHILSMAWEIIEHREDYDIVSLVTPEYLSKRARMPHSLSRMTSAQMLDPYCIRVDPQRIVKIQREWHDVRDGLERGDVYQRLEDGQWTQSFPERAQSAQSQVQKLAWLISQLQASAVYVSDVQSFADLARQYPQHQRLGLRIAALEVDADSDAHLNDLFDRDHYWFLQEATTHYVLHDFERQLRFELPRAAIMDVFMSLDNNFIVPLIPSQISLCFFEVAGQQFDCVREDGEWILYKETSDVSIPADSAMVESLIRKVAEIKQIKKSELSVHAEEPYLCGFRTGQGVESYDLVLAISRLNERECLLTLSNKRDGSFGAELGAYVIDQSIWQWLPRSEAALRGIRDF